MSRAPARRRLAAALIGGALLLATGSHSAGAEGPRLADGGWWWRLQTGLGLDLPAAPTVEPGQLPIQGAPDGPLTVAALRFTLPDEAPAGTGATLTLTVADASPPAPPGAVVLACRATSQWFGQDAGRWDDRPDGDCASSVPGSPSDDGSSWSFEVGLLLDGDQLDIVLVPGSVEGIDVVGSTVDLRFDRPRGDALSLSGDAADFDLPDLDLDLAGGSGGAGDAGGPVAAPLDGGTSAPTPGGTGSLPALTAPAPATPPSGGDPPSSPTSGAGQPGRQGPTLPVAADAARNGARWLGFVLLAGAAAAAVASAVRPAGGVPLLDASGVGGASAPPGQQPGGIGRFTRPRTGQAPSLR